MSREGLTIVPRHTLADVDGQLGVVVIVLMRLGQHSNDLAGRVVRVPQILKRDLPVAAGELDAVGDHRVEAVEDGVVGLIHNNGLRAVERHGDTVDLALLGDLCRLFGFLGLLGLHYGLRSGPGS